MTTFPELRFSKSAVRQAGKALSRNIPVDWEKHNEIVDVFAVAHGWRDSHLLPMRSVYLSIAYHMRVNRIKGDIASRLKRMNSIRRKLRETNIRLDQMNDIAGCRAILDDISQVHTLTSAIRENFRHDVRKEWHYIETPKEDGYRSHHLVFNFKPRRPNQKAHAGRRVELQIRTRLQHSWATAIEAVSLYNNQDLKHHKGSDEWLRLFVLMSGEFAEAEGCQVGKDMPPRPERIQEIKDLNVKLNAVSTLEHIKTATHFVENYIHGDGEYFLIVYTPDHNVSVENYSDPLQIARRNSDLEKNENYNTVVISAKKIENIVDLYPNYFGDVSLFVSNLRLICRGRRAQEYTMAPQHIVKPKKREIPDPTRLIRRYTQW